MRLTSVRLSFFTWAVGLMGNTTLVMLRVNKQPVEMHVMRHFTPFPNDTLVLCANAKMFSESEEVTVPPEGAEIVYVGVQ